MSASAEPSGQVEPDSYRPPPLFRLGPPVRPILARLIAAAVILPVGAVLFVAARLLPDPSGEGTHRQLGLPACGFLVATGLPCPTCGMTTAFSYAVRGRLLKALWAQPAGALLCVAMMLTIPAALVVLITGRGWQIDWYRLRPDRLLWVLLAVFLGAWGFKLLIALASRAGP